MLVVAEEDAYHVVDAGSLFGDQDLVSTATASISWPRDVWVYDATINLGDVNGDGFDDLGIPYQSSAVYLFHGPITTNTDQANADSIISSNPYSSDQLRACGDINNDGMDDLVVSYFGNSKFFASPFGATVAGGDYIAYLNTGASHSYGMYTDDGLVDVAAGDRNASGTYFQGGLVRIWAGPLSGTLDNSNATYEIEGSSTSQKFGHYTKNPGDINGDGFDDLLTSTYYSDNLGHLIYGPITGNTDASQMDTAFENCRNIQALGDTDGDGLDDFSCGGTTPDFWYLGEAL